MDMDREPIDPGAQVIAGAAVNINPNTPRVRAKSTSMETLALKPKQDKPPPTPVKGLRH
jgi:hypothetical protein